VTEKEVLELAQNQHGLITWGQLTALGFSRHLLRRHLASGAWKRVAPGVFKVTVGWPIETLQLAALLAAGDGSALSHKSAAIKWGLDVPPCPMVQISVPRNNRRGVFAGIEVFHPRDLPSDQIGQLGLLRVTSLGRTIADLPQVLTPGEVRTAVESAVRKGVANIDVINTTLEALGRGDRGAQLLREIMAQLGAGGAVSASALEVLAQGIIEDAGCGPAVRHAWEHDFKFSAELDYAFPDELVDFELDGYATHALRRSFESDRTRDRQLQWMGYRVLRYTYRQATEHRSAVVEELRRNVLQRREQKPRLVTVVPRCPPWL
jgi:hypothetical protein